MKKQTLLITILALILTANSCNKESMQDELPPITQTGANTFGFVFDGVVFTPTDADSRGFGIDGGGTSGLSVFGDYSGTENHSSRIEARRYSNIKNVRTINVYIYKLPSLGEGTYILDGYNVIDGYKKPYNSYISLYAVSPRTGELTSYFSYKNSGKIEITRYDEGFVVFSGTFRTKLLSADGTETVEITDGRFDINLKTFRQ